MNKVKKTKKISSDDFLNLIDEQEQTAAPPAFKPKTGKKSSRPSLQLSPVQKELLRFALKRSPRFVQNFVASPRGQSALQILEDSYLKLRGKVSS